MTNDRNRGPTRTSAPALDSQEWAAALAEEVAQIAQSLPDDIHPAHVLRLAGVVTELKQLALPPEERTMIRYAIT